MRIVAGTHGSRKLHTLDGDNTRPTGDKVRAALFSRIGPFFNGGMFLDLFGGSGACGLEALSRGMDQAVFVEKHPKAVNVIKKNIELLGESAQTRLIRGDAFTVFDTLDEHFDVVFLDPPYHYDKLDALLELIVNSNKLNPDCDLIIETDSKTELHENYGFFHKVQYKSYGLAALHYYRYRRED